MSINVPDHSVHVADAERVLRVHLHELADHTRSTLPMHESAIRALIAFSAARASGELLVLDEDRIIQWAIHDSARFAASYAAKRFQAVTRYLTALYRAGVLAANAMAELKARCGGRSWDCITRAIQSPDPAAALDGLQIETLPPGPLNVHIESYLQLKRSLGMQYTDQHRILTSFDLFLGIRGKTSPTDVARTDVCNWLATMSCGPRQRRNKVLALKRFLDHLVSIEVIAENPAITVLSDYGRPHKPPFRPFIFTVAQVHAILEAAKRLPRTHKFPLRAQTCHAAFALMYALGLRHREVRQLRFCDVDIGRDALFIARTKFYKSRLVPFGPKVRQCLEDYMTVRQSLYQPPRRKEPLFVAFRRAPLAHSTLWQTFRDIVDPLDWSTDPDHTRPRLHDLRHTFAVHRLLRWYREGVNVQEKLAQLSTFMGHTDIRSTEVYLTVTAELLGEANSRFYASFGTLIEKEAQP